MRKVEPSVPLTKTCALTVVEPDLAVIVVVPMALAVITPWKTVATESSEEAHSILVASPTTLIVVISPTFIWN